jgi:excisionase family DNA binding protein
MTGEMLLYSPQEAAELLGVGRSQMFELIGRGDVESVKIGRLRKIPREALTAYVERLRALPA